MPNATSIQLELRLPIKKESLLEFLEVYQATPNNKTKYPMTNENNKPADMMMFKGLRRLIVLKVSQVKVNLSTLQPACRQAGC